MSREYPNHRNLFLPSDYPGHPWHLRPIYHGHERRFAGLTLLHELTLGWIELLKMERAPYLIERGLNSAAVENLWMLESLSERKLEDLLDETDPNDVLGRLDYTIWAAQAYTLDHILQKTTEEDRNDTESALQQTAWRQGRRVAEERSRFFSEEARNDLPSLILTCADTPFLGQWTRDSHAPATHAGFLIKRSIRGEVSLELHACPHQKHYHEVPPVADTLCLIHSHWLRGYAYGLNPRVSMEIKPGEVKPGAPNQRTRCEHRWHAITHSLT